MSFGAADFIFTTSGKVCFGIFNSFSNFYSTVFFIKSNGDIISQPLKTTQQIDL
ncbi:hypothetical protein [uncultured Gammaproteobacteria bacterium]|nr:hypothetical protein [uncultured Gammaproteobacteria bacterium]CAC9637433.1 hypothetical protein [uncultured Gammaproteobacteria bacterium]VVH52313.1 hypothetical protein BPUTSESOX_2412 [uncultured Gammaproteobacteria bacterium]